MEGFALKAGEKIPLHIHLDQFGLAYLLQGKYILSVYAIDKIEDENFFKL